MKCIIICPYNLNLENSKGSCPQSNEVYVYNAFFKISAYSYEIVI